MAAFPCLSMRRVSRPALAALAVTLIAVPAFTLPSLARGPDKIADVAEAVLEAVVNISTSQTVEARQGPTPQLPPGSPFEDFFDEFFKNRRGGQGDNQNRERTPRRVSSLGSGFFIDPSGLVVTNNHVISEADEINVVLNDGTKLKAEIVGRDQKTDMALLKVDPAGKSIKAVKFGDSEKLRIGEWVIAMGNPI